MTSTIWVKLKTISKIAMCFMVLSLLCGLAWLVTYMVSNHYRPPEIESYYASFSSYSNPSNIEAEWRYHTDTNVSDSCKTRYNTIMPGDKVIIKLYCDGVKGVNGLAGVENLHLSKISATDPNGAELDFMIKNIYAKPISWSKEITGVPEPYFEDGKLRSGSKLIMRPISPEVSFRLPDNDALWGATITVRIIADVIYPVWGIPPPGATRGFGNVRKESDRRYTFKVVSKKILQADKEYTDLRNEWISKRYPFGLSEDILFASMFCSLVIALLSVLPRIKKRIQNEVARFEKKNKEIRPQTILDFIIDVSLLCGAGITVLSMIMYLRPAQTGFSLGLLVLGFILLVVGGMWS